MTKCVGKKSSVCVCVCVCLSDTCRVPPHFAAEGVLPEDGVGDELCEGPDVMMCEPEVWEE